MRSCIVWSSPRAGTHLVMTGLHVAGMTEVNALTAEEWGYKENGRNEWRVLDIPATGHYRFGAHQHDPGLVDAFVASPLLGIYIKRNIDDQARSLRAYLSVIRGQEITMGDAVGATIRSVGRNAVWAKTPGVLTVRFEDLVAGKGWDAIWSHLGGDPVDTSAIMRRVPPSKGERYWKNTRPSVEYYGEGVA